MYSYEEICWRRVTNCTKEFSLSFRLYFQKPKFSFLCWYFFDVHIILMTGCLIYWTSEKKQWSFRLHLRDNFKSITRRPQGVRDRQPPRSVTKFKIWKRLKLLEIEAIFKKFQHFWFEKSYLLWLKIEHILRNFMTFSKLFQNFNFYVEPRYQSREMSEECYLL